MHGWETVRGMVLILAVGVITREIATQRRSPDESRLCARIQPPVSASKPAITSNNSSSMPLWRRR